MPNIKFSELPAASVISRTDITAAVHGGVSEKVTYAQIFSVLNDTDVTAALGYTPLDTAGGTMTGDLILNADPSTALQAATKGYVDNIATGLKWKTDVVAATTANITLSGEQSIDGVSVLAGDRVLVKNQSTQTQNGIYVAAVGAWSRATDADTGAELLAATVYIRAGGATNGGTQWSNNNTSITIGATNITFAQIAGAGVYTNGAGLNLTGNVFSIAVNGVEDNMIRQSAGLSVIGNAANSTANVADITAASDFQVLRRSGTAIGFGAINLASSNAVTGVLPIANGGSPWVVAGSDIHYSTGNVGIGVAAPTALFHVEISGGSGRQLTSLYLAGGNSTGNGASIGLGSTQTISGYVSGLQSASNEGDLVFGTQTAGAYSEKMRILGANGNVGIGTTGPTTKLQVSVASTSDMVEIFSSSTRRASLRSDGLYITAGNTGVYRFMIYDRINNGSVMSYDCGIGMHRWEANTSPLASLESGSGITTYTLGLSGTRARISMQNAAGNFVNIQPPTSLTNHTYTLPSNVPAADGYALTSTTAGVMSWSNIVSSQWTTATNDIYYNTGRVWIGQTSGTYRLDVLNATTGQTASNSVTQFSSAGATFDTTGVNPTLSQVGRFIATSTRSAGANDLWNQAGYFTASGAQVNHAIYTLAGDIMLDQGAWKYNYTTKGVEHVTHRTGFGIGHVIKNDENNSLAAAYLQVGNADDSVLLRMQAPGQGDTVEGRVGTYSNAPLALVANSNPLAYLSAAGDLTVYDGASTFGFVKGKLRASANATTGLTPGAFAATTDATIVIYDGSGQAYQVPCKI